MVFFSETVEADNKNRGIKIDHLKIKFASAEVGLPDVCENAHSVTSPEMFPEFFCAIYLLQRPFENVVNKLQPNCLVADSFFPWANSVAEKFGTPCLTFHGGGYFSQCIISNLLHYEPHKKLSSDSETFVVPGDLPNEIKLAGSELSPYEKKEGPKFLQELMDEVNQEKRACYGVIMNTFYELEPTYAAYYEKVLSMYHWHIGPLSLLYIVRNKMDEITEGESPQ